MFDKGSNPYSATHRLFSLKQCKRSVEDYSLNFWILAEETGWEEKGLWGVFLYFLNNEQKRELAAKELPASLDALISMFVHIGGHMHRPKGVQLCSHNITGLFRSVY